MKWDRLFDTRILNRGRQYFNKGLVRNLQQNGSSYNAEVIGSITYDVLVQLVNENRPRMFCTCPYSIDGNRCKHMAAVLYAIEDSRGVEGKSVSKPKLIKQIFPFKRGNELTGKTEQYQYFDLDRITKGFTFFDTTCTDAKKLIENGKIRLLKVEVGYANQYDKGGQIIKANGVVSCDTKNVVISIVLDRQSILQASCHATNCYYSYDSYYYNRWGEKKQLCVHETALLFLVWDYLKQNNVGDATDRAASQLLMQYRRRPSANNLSGNDSLIKKVTIEPRLEKKAGFYYASFRIGVDKMYIARNLTELVEIKERKDILPLGTKNQLDFATAEFTEQSQKYYDFIYKHVSLELKRRENAIRAYSYYDDSEKIKGNMILYGQRLDDYFDLVKDMSIPFDNKDERGSAKTLVFREKNPQITLEIQAETDAQNVFDGISVQGDIPEVVEGLDYIYYLEDNEFRRISQETAAQIAPILEAAPYGEVSFVVGRNNLSEFYHRVLPAIRECVNVVENDSEIIEKYIWPEVEFVFYLDAEKKNVTCLGKAKYGDEEYKLYDWLDMQKYKPANRDAYREQEILEAVRQFFPGVDREQRLFHCNDDEDIVYGVLEQGVDALLQLGEVKSTDRFKNLKIRRKNKITVGVSVESEIMNLTISSEDLTQAELLDILYSYKRRKKYYRLKSGDFINIQDESLEELAVMMETLHISPKEFAKGKMQIPVYRALYVDKMLEQNENIYANRDQHFRRLVKEFKTVKESDFEVPTELERQMRNYQIVGHKWLRTLEKYGFGGILADDMGLGKTLQMISILLAARKEGREAHSLVVTPASLVYNWQEEFARFAPELSVCSVVGGQAERKAIIQNYQNWDVLITSYDLLKRDVAEYEEKQFAYQVIDEAQYIKNHTTIAAKAVKVIKSKQRFALTGTPIENRLSELWSIFDYLMPGFLYGYDTFKKELETPIAKYKDEDVSKRLKRMVSPFILRRLKQDVLKDLPEKIEEVRYAKMEEKQQRLYDAQVVHMRDVVQSQAEESFQKNKLQILAELTKIRQICCDPSLMLENYDGESAKRLACMDLIKSAMEGEHKMLIFSQFTSMLELLEQDLAEEGIVYYKITGATPKEKRLELVRAFNSDTTPVFLISLKAGGTGLNLTGADIVIHYDPWWNLAVQNQATDRAHRIGQEKIVSVYKLIVKNSIEEKILHMQETKKNLAEEILSGESGNISSMSKQELLELLQG